jgi:8-oxo-dGTP pyrophosphatase MutT (NUDIX family)
MFKDGSCTAVQGRIDPRDVCKLWEQAPAAMSMILGLAWNHPGMSPGFVESYDRMEKGHLERVSGYPKKESSKLKAPESYVVELPEGQLMEVGRYKLWLHKSEGKPGPRASYDAGQRVTWRRQGKSYEGRIRGTPDDPALADKFTPIQSSFKDAKGDSHWGLWGGAGLLLHHTDENGVTRYLLQRRSGSVQQGGTYSTPGGAIDKPGGIPETPERAAFREAEEEGWGNLLPNATVTGVQTEHFGGEPGAEGTWAYHTVSASVPEMISPSGKGSHAGEASGYKWVTPEEMAKIPLHTDFMKTATALGRPEDVPNPTPQVSYSGAKGPRHPLERDDYKPGQRVTWTKGGEQHEGFVQEGAVNAQGKPVTLKKGDLPLYYPVKAENGETYPVNYYRMRLHASEAPESAAKVEQWEKDRAAAEAKAKAQPKMGYGEGKPSGPEVIKAHSLSLPGLTHTVPARINGRPVVAIYEHPKRGHLVVMLGQRGFATVRNGKIGSVGVLKSGEDMAQKQGWTSIPFSPPQQPEPAKEGGAGPLGKVVKAAEHVDPDLPQVGDTVVTPSGASGVLMKWGKVKHAHGTSGPWPLGQLKKQAFPGE